MDDVTSRLEQRLAGVEDGLAELRAQISDTRAETTARFDEVPTRTETRADMNARFDEARRHVEVLLEDQRAETRLVAEGVAALGERMERGFTELRELVAGNHRFWEVAFLDHERRIRGLEGRGA